MDSDSTTSSNLFAIDLYEKQLHSRLDQHRELGANAVNFVLETIENYVRTGWLLVDIKLEMHGVEGAFESWVERNLPISISQAYRYIKASTTFERDSENLADVNSVREAVGLSPLLLEVDCGPNLLDQIVERKANSFADLMRDAGISKPKTLSLPAIPKEQKPAFLKLGKALSAAYVRFQRINKVDPIDAWGTQEKRAICDSLKPLADLYQGLCLKTLQEMQSDV